MKRKYNFYAGPSTLPLPVLEEIQREILDYKGNGLSIIETSHRSTEYDEVHHEAIAHIRELLEVPDNYHVLLLGGGASLQFGMVPLNLLHFAGEGACADYVVSGSWAKKAYGDAKKLGTTNAVFDGRETNYMTLPATDAIKPSSGSSYVHITSNETIGGLQFQEWPDTGDVPLVADMSSDIMSRRVPVERFGVIYAGAQKNLGPAGVTVVIIRKDIAERSPEHLPDYLSYRIHAEKESLFNTPPVFSVYALSLVLRYIKQQGGIGPLEETNRVKAELLYQAIADSDGFYRCPVDKRYRSRMNVVFRIADESLEPLFLEEASKHDMVGLKGHRSVGGLRASIYNAMPQAGAEALATLMRSFAARR